MLNFVDAQGNSHYNYRYFLLGVILINSLLTFCIERLIVSKVTKHYDKKAETKKQKKFDDLMAELEEPEIFVNVKEKL